MGAGYSLFFSRMFHYQKHVFVETYGLNYWPVSCLCCLPAVDALPPSAPSLGSKNLAYIVHGTELRPPFLNQRNYELSK